MVTVERSRGWDDTMTLLEIVQDVAKNIGIEPPDSAQPADADAIKLVQFVNDTGVELSRRVNWNILTLQATITGNGSDDKFALPSNFSRLSDGLCVTCDGSAVRGGLTSDEWLSLSPVDGTPRFFRLLGGKIGLYPYPENGMIVRVSYLTVNWAKNVSDAPIARMTTDNDTSTLPDQLLVRGAVWRFLRHVGKDFSDHMAEYEAMLLDYANAEAGERKP